MSEPVKIHHALLYCGDSLDVLATLDPNSVDAVVTDPPYGIRFMGKAWDGKDIEATMRCKTRKNTVRPDGFKRHDGAAFAAGTYDLSLSANQAFQKWTEEWAALCLRVLKPGGHLLSFSSPRMYHRMTSGIEDAGFDIRDQIMWLFGSGFPKSHNLEGKWDGWGTALKPAHEPIVVARKPLIGTVAENVLTHGTGALNIDGCRVPTDDKLSGSGTPPLSYAGTNPRPYHQNAVPIGCNQHQNGRWPANVIHDGSEEVLAAFPEAPGQSGAVTGREQSSKTNNVYGQFDGRPATQPRGDSGSAARFFYCAKTSRKDRNEGLADPGPQFTHGTTLRKVEKTETKGNHHPTVKPTDLMRYLCRLVTPPGGTVLDPFMGSGSTGKAALKEGFRFIGIEREPEYFEIAKVRVSPSHEQPEMIIPMPKPQKEVEPVREPDLFSFTAA